MPQSSKPVALSQKAVSLGPPVVGAYVCASMAINAATTSTTFAGAVILPAGLSARIVGISICGSGLTDVPTVQLGSASTIAKYMTATNVSSVAAEGTIATTSVPAGGTLVATVTNNTTAVCVDGVNVSVWLYTTAPATEGAAGI